MKQYHVAVAAEAYVAAFCAQAGLDVSIQYGANQPEYDLIVKRGKRFIALSVKGSQDGGWGLCQNYKRGRTYHEAIDAWCGANEPSIVYALVQFWGTEVGQSPRVYLATPAEIADLMKLSRGGMGNTMLLENYSYKKGVGKNTTDRLPDSWKFSVQRVNELLDRVV
jgi:hypothetical protein